MGRRPKKAVVTHALQEYIQKRQQAHIVQLFGTVEYDADFDCKAVRQRKQALRKA